MAICHWFCPIAISAYDLTEPMGPTSLSTTAKLDYGSDEDDDFKPAEAPPSKRPKPAVKEAPKKAEKKTKPDSVGSTSSSAVNEKQKAGRASLDDKLFQRDLEVALRLSQNAQASEGQCLETGPEHKPADSIVEQNGIATFPDNLELAGEVVVHSEPGPETSKPSVLAEAKEEEDYQPEKEESSEEEEEDDDASDEDYGGDSGSDDDGEFAPSKVKASRSRKEPVAKKPPAAPKKAAGAARTAAKKSPAPSAAPHAATKGPATIRGKMLASSASASSSPVSPPVPRVAPRLAGAPKSSPSAAPRPLPQRTAPEGNVPMTVPKFSSGQLPASGIRLGLSRRSVSKPLHSVVKVQQ
ncbi:hypothetical protein HPB49_006316 [Dermacentor silvarum]|uniref:Uncharacterized protein n=1 Tax=Dermacentor silvarum TaxID=543639 RepID=A0ACB8CVQ5_DERSI|nr:RAD51-associated protein 1 [Dermacentor silvarum]KAH7953239.1 hypothetical protein HPB49_006316 [Dermacentor silvarum]